MAEEDLRAAMSESMAGILEQAAFIFCESAAEEPDWPGNLVEATLVLEGRDRACLKLLVSGNLASSIAEELLGVGEGEEAEGDAGADAVGEVLNMVAGMLAADRRVFSGPVHIGTPHVRRTRPGEEQTVVGGRLTRVWQSTDDGEPLELVMVTGRS